MNLNTLLLATIVIKYKFVINHIMITQDNYLIIILFIVLCFACVVSLIATLTWCRGCEILSVVAVIFVNRYITNTRYSVAI